MASLGKRCEHIHTRGSRAGQQCMKPATAGYNYCEWHGSRLAPAKAAAERAFALARMPAIEGLYEITERFTSTNTCPTCGGVSSDPEQQKVFIAAAKIILDRTGFPATVKHEVSQADGSTMDLKLLTDGERGELLALLAQVKDFKERVRTRLGTGVINVTPGNPLTTP